MDIRCTQCNRLLIKNYQGSGGYGEMKCPKCHAINVIGYDSLGFYQHNEKSRGVADHEVPSAWSPD